MTCIVCGVACRGKGIHKTCVSAYQMGIRHWEDEISIEWEPEDTVDFELPTVKEPTEEWESQPTQLKLVCTTYPGVDA